MEKLEKVWLDFFLNEDKQNNWWIRKQELWERQNGTIVQIQGKGSQYRQFKYDTKEINDYIIHLSFLIKQDKSFHMEEQVLHYRLETKNNKMMKHEEICWKQPTEKTENQIKQRLSTNRANQKSFVYDRSEAVRYAERWWNSYNPAFEIFEDDCTNYISQCLLAGGAPMRGAPNREVGWWYQNNNWSFSWAVAHSLRWYLSGSTQGLQAREVESPEELLPGDVICYDFEGDGRWDHNTIVVNRDASGMPLVNAHTNNSRNRYWSYEDSAAWTPNIQYKFFRIGE